MEQEKTISTLKKAFILVFFGILFIISIFILGMVYHEKKWGFKREIITTDIYLSFPKNRDELDKRLKLIYVQKVIYEEMLRWPEFRGAKRK